MADDKKSGGGGGRDVFEEVVGIVILLLFFGTILGGLGIGKYFENKEGGLSGIFPTGEISLGEEVINKKDIDVHRIPAGSIIGAQKKRAVGKVVEGPANLDNRVWWLIDYKNAPDGWVKESNLTSYVWAYLLFNIFPIIFSSIKPFLILLSVILFVLIIVVMIKMNKLDNLKQKRADLKARRTDKDRIVEDIEREQSEQNEESDPLIATLPTDNSAPQTSDVHNRRWAKVETLINSHSVNDWRQAIIEADIILEEMLDKIGYRGDSIGDKLKQVEESDFLTLNQAWEAHKIRNRIAHKGSDYILSRDDAERAIELYRQVFQEFYLI